MKDISPWTRPIEERFWKKVNKQGPDECWLWTASVNGAGYGQIWTSMIHLVRGIRYDSHRYSWVLHNGPIPDGKYVLHTCDNKRCVNPKHLYLGDCVDNANDALERGQKLIGSKCSFAKLTAEQVNEIRQLKKLGYTNNSLAQRFGVTQSTIWRAYNGRAYRDVTLLR